MVLQRVNTFFKIFLIIFKFFMFHVEQRKRRKRQKVEILLFNLGVIRSTWNNASDASDKK